MAIPEEHSYGEISGDFFRTQGFYPWDTAVSHGMPWNPAGTRGTPRKQNASRGTPCVPVGRPTVSCAMRHRPRGMRRIPMGVFCGNPANATMIYHTPEQQQSNFSPKHASLGQRNTNRCFTGREGHYSNFQDRVGKGLSSFSTSHHGFAEICASRIGWVGEV